MPAKAGIQCGRDVVAWTPAFAGVTTSFGKPPLDVFEGSSGRVGCFSSEKSISLVDHKA